MPQPPFLPLSHPIRFDVVVIKKIQAHPQHRLIHIPTELNTFPGMRGHILSKLTVHVVDGEERILGITAYG